MTKPISNPTISRPWSPLSSLHDVRPLQFRKGALPQASDPQDDSSRSTAISVNGNGLSSSGYSTPETPPQSRTPSSLYDPDDPAFSSDPYHHPDHHGLPINNVRGKDGPSAVMRHPEAEFDPPPAYNDDTSDQPKVLERPHVAEETTSAVSSLVEETQGSSHLRERAQASYSPIPTPTPSTSNLPQSQRTNSQEDMGDQDGVLLAYLQDVDTEPEVAPNRNIPMSLRPHMGLQVTSQPPTDPQMRGRPVPDTTGLTRSASTPATMWTNSEPLARTNTERPRPPRRGNTSSPRRLPDLDRIDELDESTPLGVPLHHRGPYEMQGKVTPPPPRPALSGREYMPPSKQHVLVAAVPPDAPPPPVPYRLNLKPGEFLTRVAPDRSRSTPPEHNYGSASGPYPSFAGLQPLHQQHRFNPQSQPDPRYVRRESGRNDWSPEELYENYPFPPAPTIPRDVPRHPHRVDPRYNTPSSSASTSRSDLRPNIPAPDINLPPARPFRQGQIISQEPPQQAAQLSRSVSQPLYASSASSTYTSSSASLARAPPSSSDRLRPKRIVMPAPLRQHNQNHVLPAPSDMNHQLGPNSVSPQPSAAVIPVHDPKKNNLLKKRASTGSALHQNRNPLTPERAPSKKGFFNLAGGFGRSSPPQPDVGFPKASRKLSKRVKAL